MPYTEEQLHDMLDIDGPPTIRQLALQNLHNKEQEAKSTFAVEPTAPTMLGQEEEEEEEMLMQEEKEQLVEQKKQDDAMPSPAVQLHDAAAPPAKMPWLPIILVAIGVACIAMIVARTNRIK